MKNFQNSPEYHQLEVDEESPLSRTLLQSMALAGKESGSGKVAHMPNHRIKGNILQVLLAGYETTASSMMWILYMLSKHPEVQRKVQEEVDEVLQSQYNLLDLDAITDETCEALSSLDTNSFPYTMAVIHETMRLRPVAPFLGAASGNEKITLLGHELPENSLVFMLFRVASIKACPSADPTSFDPSRWIKSDSMDQETFESYHKTMMRQILGFGGGARICPGKYDTYNRIFSYQ